MTGRHLGCALLLTSATILLCCAATNAEEGPILPGLDAIPQSPPYVADPSTRDAAPRARRTLRPPQPRQDAERERPQAHDGAKAPPRLDESSADAQAPSAKRPGIRGLLPEKPADRPPFNRSLEKPELDRTKSSGRAQDAPRSAAGRSSDAMSKRRNPSDPRSPERAMIGDRREPLADPWGASRQQSDPRTRAALEREKAWRAGQGAAPAANSRASSAGPSRAPQAGRQPGKPAPPPRTGQPTGNRLAR
jgi:hypothetical protein